MLASTCHKTRLDKTLTTEVDPTHPGSHSGDVLLAVGRWSHGLGPDREGPWSHPLTGCSSLHTTVASPGGQARHYSRNTLDRGQMAMSLHHWGQIGTSLYHCWGASKVLSKKFCKFDTHPLLVTLIKVQPGIFVMFSGKSDTPLPPPPPPPPLHYMSLEWTSTSDLSWNCWKIVNLRKYNLVWFCMKVGQIYLPEGTNNALLGGPMSG